MLALLAATVVAAAQPAPQVKVYRGAPPAGAELPMHMRAVACGVWDAQPVRREAPSGDAQRLDELPPANHELTVLRLDEKGCSKPVVVRENVSDDGRFAKPRD